MASALPDALEPIVNLAKAREILILDAAKLMPEGGQAQRNKMLATLDTLIEGALATTSEPLPEQPETLDDISKRAWEYVAQKQAQPAASTPNENLPAYDKLKQVFKARSVLAQTIGEAGDSIIEWLLMTGTMSEVKNQVLGEAAMGAKAFMHRCLAKPEVKQWIDEVRADLNANPEALGETDRRNFALMERLWTESSGSNEKLLGDWSQAKQNSYLAWLQARQTGDFSTWLPHFKQLVELTREKGKALNAASPYQALLGIHNPGLSDKIVDEVFDELRTKLPPLMDAVIKKQEAEPLPLSLPEVSIEAQKRIAKKLMELLGHAANHARLDESPHPIFAGERDDVRITARYDKDNILYALMSVVHEAGHALYARNLPKGDEWEGQPIGDAQSKWVHESQSLFWDMQIGRSKEFMEFLSTFIKEELKVDGPQWSADNLYKLSTRVKPGCIRTEADEVTYPMHVILRHTLEQDLINGSLAPKDVPEAWAKGMKELLDVNVPDDARGCMQDIHWPGGATGYFPAYTFGALGAAQLMEKAKQDMPGIGENIKSGNFSPIREWLAKKIHKHGSYYSGEELMKEATGKLPSAEPWLNHIQERYLGTKWQDRAQRAAGGNERAA